MIKTFSIELESYSRGFHLITNEIEAHLTGLPDVGLIHLFLNHTSAGLTINENADSAVRNDFEQFINSLIPENLLLYTHILEGDDDMPAHIKASLFGNELTIPIKDGRLNMGIWQGVYLCEFRNNSTSRSITVTVIC